MNGLVASNDSSAVVSLLQNSGTLIGLLSGGLTYSITANDPLALQELAAMQTITMQNRGARFSNI